MNVPVAQPGGRAEAGTYPLAVLGQYPPLAHHPTCARHDHHLLRPFGIPLCLGCVCLYGGFLVAGAGTVWWLPFRAEPSALVVFACGVTAALPTFAQPFIQKKAFKILARTLLGGGLALGVNATLASLVGPGGVLGAVAFLVTAVVLAALALLLRRRRSDDPCRGCPWGAFPLCAHNLEALRALRARGGADPGFLDAMIADLEPLAATPIGWGAVPRARGDAVGFEDGRSREVSAPSRPSDTPSPRP